jgi:hypothetical protein
MTVVLIYAAIAFSAIVQICTHPRITKAFIWKSLLALAVFAVHCGIGFLVLVLLIFAEGHRSNASALGGIVAWLGWLGLGTLGLVRFAPRTIEPHCFKRRTGDRSRSFCDDADCKSKVV